MFTLRSLFTCQKPIYLLALLFLFSACAMIHEPYYGVDEKTRFHRIREGETLYGIGYKTQRDFRLIARWNGIQDPFKLAPGRVIRLFPDNDRPTKTTEPDSRPTTNQAASSTTKKPSHKNLKLLWRWPLKGAIAKNYRQSGKKGFDIIGQYGEPVRAAAAGKVVYSGQGLIGYGNLVIVKHDVHFLSAYGSNSRILVREGDDVRMGQQIAEVGLGAGKQPVLHFEIRKSGKPVNPLFYLPNP